MVVFITAFLLREWVIANQPLAGIQDAEAVPGLQEREQPAALPPPPLPVGQEHVHEAVPAVHGQETAALGDIAPLAMDTPDHLRLLNVSLRSNPESNTPEHREPDTAAEDQENPFLPSSSSPLTGASRPRMSPKIPSYEQDERVQSPILGAEAGSRIHAIPDPADPMAREEHIVAQAPLRQAPSEVESASEASSSEYDDTDGEDHDHPAAAPLGAANRLRRADAGGQRDLAPEDLAAIQAMENEEDLFFEADLDGVLEAIGIQGPLLALLQNSALMILLIAVLLALAVWVPLMLGRTVVATNALRVFFVPVNVVRLATDPLADILVALVNKARTALLGGKFRQRMAVEASKPHNTLMSRILQYMREMYTTMTLARPQESTPPPPSTLVSSYKSFRSLSVAYLAYLRIMLKQTTSTARLRWRTMASHDTDLDRILCIAVGYIVFICGAALYLRYTQNLQARNATRAVRDALRQHFVLGKVCIILLPPATQQ